MKVVKISELNPGKAEFYYIGHNPVNNASIAVRVNSGECYQFSMDRHVTKI